MDDPWADTPSSTFIPPRPPKADRRSIPQPIALEPEVEVEEVKADETTDEIAGFTDEPEEDVHESTKSEPEETGEEVEYGFDDFGQNGNPVEPEEDGGFDDFDDFDAPAGGPSATGEDGFGDFGDFEEGDFETHEPTNQEEEIREVPARQWVSQKRDGRCR